MGRKKPELHPGLVHAIPRKGDSKCVWRSVAARAARSARAAAASAIASRNHPPAAMGEGSRDGTMGVRAVAFLAGDRFIGFGHGAQGFEASLAIFTGVFVDRHRCYPG